MACGMWRVLRRLVLHADGNGDYNKSYERTSGPLGPSKTVTSHLGRRRNSIAIETRRKERRRFAGQGVVGEAEEVE